MDDGKVTSENHVYSPFQLNKSFDKPLKIGNGTNVFDNGNVYEGTSGSDQPSSPNLISSSPFSFSLKKLGNYSLPPSNTNLNSSLQSIQKMNDLQQENLNLKKEIEAKETKLSSTVKSIKQFWSPELKKERLARKEERERNLELKEQLSIANTQIQEYKKTLEDLEHELNAQQQKSKNLMQKLEEQNRNTLYNNLKEQFDLQADKILSLSLINKSNEEKISLYTAEKKTLEDKIYQLQSQIENNSINLLNESQYISNNKKFEKQEEEISLLTLTLDELEAKYNELLEDNEEKNKCISDLEIILVDKEQKEQYHESVLIQLQTCRNTIESQEEENLKLKYDNAILKENERRNLESLSSLEKCLTDKEMQITNISKEVQELRARECSQVEHNKKTEELLLSKDKQFDILQKELELLQQQLQDSEMKLSNNSKDDEIKILNENVEQLNTKLKTTELQNSESVKKLSKVMEELGDLKNRMSSKEKELKENQTKVEQLNTKLKTAELQNSESVKKLSKTMEELGDLKNKFASKEKALKEHQIKVEQLNTKLKTAELQNSESVKKLSKAMEEFADIKNTLFLKEKELKEHQIKLSSKNDELSSKDAIILTCNEEIKELKNASLNFKKTVDALQADLSEKNSLIVRFKKEKETQLSKTVSFVVYEDMKRECESLSSANLQQKMTLEDLQNNLKSALETNSKLESEIENYKIELVKINMEYTETKEQYKEFEQINNDLKKDLQDSRTKVENFEKQERRSVIISDKKKAEDNQIVKQLQDENTQKLNRIIELEKQVTEKTKQLALIKKTQNFEKEKQHLLVNEKLKTDIEAKNQVEQLKNEVAKNKERITVLEDALRESVNVVIECENISASKSEFSEFEKAITNIKNAFLIFLMSEKDALIRSMIATRKRHSDELQNIRVNNLLSSISEKDTQIAHFELSNSKIKRNEIIQLKKDKEKLMEELKEQNNNRVLETNLDPNEDSILLELRNAPSEQVYEAVRHLCTNNSRLEFYIEEFWEQTKDMCIELLHSIEEPPQKSAKFTKTEKLSKDELMKELKLVTDHSVNLKKYVYGLLSKLEG
ncbi:ELKS/Rab6-interacting/CAST family member 1 isoform X4 [Hydra vulgaris]|uniref:ELKS/Rab6-interacting/CAST family member 1 isoform X4 n=1 Tax=Hydra vulgaris TaxID=6087 RepID=A0ABM4D8L2_HYDVU